MRSRLGTLALIQSCATWPKRTRERSLDERSWQNAALTALRNRATARSSGDRARASQDVDLRGAYLVARCLRGSPGVAASAEDLGRFDDDQGVALDEAPAPAAAVVLEHLELPHART